MATRDSIAGGVLNFMGLTGAPLPTSSIAPRIPNPADNLAMTQFTDLGQVMNSEIWSNYAVAMTRPTTYSAMLQTWREMAGWDLLAAALVQVVDEAIQRDDLNPGSIWYECDDPKIEEELNGMLELLNVEEILPNQFWFLSALGNAFEKLEYSRGDGVTGMSFVDPQDIRRYWLQKNRQCIGFRWDKGKVPDKDNFWLVNQAQKIERVDVGQSTEKLWYPWDFMHFRRMYRMRESEHGEPIFDEAQAIYKKMRIALDQMVVHRAQIQPDRYVVNVDTGEQPPAEQMRTLQRWKQSMRSKLSFGPGGGTNSMNDPTDFKSFYNALGLDSVLWVARPKGFTHAIEKLAGTASVPDVYDVEMLTNLFFSVIGMPKEWLGIGEKGGQNTMASGKALLAQDIRFLRKIKALRRPIITGYRWLGYFHLLLKGKDINNINLRTKMSEIGQLDEQIKLETLKAQAEVLQVLGDVMETYALPREAWVEVIFKKYMHLPEDIVNAFVTALPREVEQQPMESKKKSMSTMAMLNEVRMRLDGNPRAKRLLSELQELSDGKKPDHKPGELRYTTENVLREPMKMMKPNDVIVSSFGPVEEARKTPQPGAPGYRRFNYGAGSNGG
jgi:hypothetical protein